MPNLTGAPTLAANGDGRLEVFSFAEGLCTEQERSFWHIWQTGWSNGWSEWAQLFGDSAYVPDAVAHSNGDGRLEVVVSSGQNIGHIWQIAWSDGWSWVEDFGPPPPSPLGPSQAVLVPDITASADGLLAVFASNGYLWVKQQSTWSNGWSDWQSLGSPTGLYLNSLLTAVRSSDGRIEVFARAKDSYQMWNIHQTSAGGPFSDWVDWAMPGTVIPFSSAGLAPSADGRLQYFIVGSDGALWHRWETAVGTNSWSDWVSHGNPIGGSQPGPEGGLYGVPRLVANADGRLEVFVPGGTGIWHIWQTEANGSWSGWDGMLPPSGVNMLGGPAVMASGDGRLELFAAGSDSSLWHRWQTKASNGWSEWLSHGHP